MDEDTWHEVEEFLALTQEFATLINAVKLVGRVEPNTALLLVTHLDSMVSRADTVQSCIRKHSDSADHPLYAQQKASAVTAEDTNG